jgi:hypothetical protein
MTTVKTTSAGNTSNESRRRFLQLATFGAGAVALSSLLVGKARAADLPHLTLDDPTAKALGYVEDSSKVDASKYATHKPGQNCMGCNFYQGAAGSEYGACTLFPGKAVHSKGWCSGFVAKPA